MKKRCKYCNGIVKVKEEEIKNIENNGRGILCDLCGAFIEIPKQMTILQEYYKIFNKIFR